MTKTKNRKRKLETPVKEENEPEPPPLTRSSDEPPPKKERWLNKQRVLVVASRGINYTHRHLLQDIRALMPHCRPENKIERKESLTSVNEICSIKNCNKAILFEARHHDDLYMWLSTIPDGPSAKFLVENIYTMAEMKLVGNCLKASRPLLSFDSNFDKFQHYAMLKEMFIQIFGVPNHHPKSQPFIDHIYSFSVLDNRIWFRNYQILSEDGALTEIGPRYVLNPIKIFNSSFGGETLWSNPHYVTPAMHRRQLVKQAKANKYVDKLTAKVHNELKAEGQKDENDLDEEEELYSGDPLEKAKEIVEREKKNAEKSQGEIVPKKSPNPKKKKLLKKKKSNQVNDSSNEDVRPNLKKKKAKLNGFDSSPKVVAKKPVKKLQKLKKSQKAAAVNNSDE